MSLRVMTCNIRNSGAHDGPHRWELRRRLWAQTVQNFDPDLLGTQEVLADQHGDLRRFFPEHGFSGVGREDGAERGERSLILYRLDRFELLDRGDFWLSTTPVIAGSRSWDSACCRICSWVRLKDTQSGRQMLYANVHFDHVGTIARRESARLLIDQLDELSKKSAVILTGDFNSTELDEPYRLLTGAGLIDSYRSVHPVRQADESTFHDFGRVTDGLRIDWILHSTELVAKQAAIDRTRGVAGEYPSDHDAVTAVLDWVDADAKIGYVAYADQEPKSQR